MNQLAIDESLLEWGKKSSDNTQRLFYGGEPYSIIKTPSGYITRDPYPSEIPLLDYQQSFQRVVELDGLGLIQSTNREVFSIASLGNAYSNKTYSPPPQIQSSFLSPAGNKPAPSKWDTLTMESSKGGTPFRVDKDSTQHSFFSKRNITVAVSLFVVACVALVGIVILKPFGSSTPSSQTDNTIVSDTFIQESPLGAFGKGAVSTVPSGWGNKPEWTFQLRDSSVAISSFDSGTVLSSNKNITIIDSPTGKINMSIAITELPSVIAESTFGSKDSGIVWRISDTIYLWSAKNKKLVHFSISTDASVITSGTGTLLKQDGVSYVILMEGLFKLPESAGDPIAVDGDTIVSSGWNGPIKLFDLASGKITQQILVPPAPGMVPYKWFGVGLGKIIVAWKEPNLSNDGSTPVTLAVNNYSDGSSLSSVSTKIESITKAILLFGQGDKEFSLGPYLFSASTGKVLVEGSATVSGFSVIAGNYSYGSNLTGGGVTTYIDGQLQTKITATTPLSVISSNDAIVRVSTDTLALLKKE